MDESYPERLRLAARHIAQGELSSARTMLVAHIKHAPDSDDAWLLLSLAVEDPVRQLQCLEKALSINPENLRAKQRLKRIRASGKHSSSSDPLPRHVPPLMPNPGSLPAWPPPAISGGDSNTSGEMAEEAIPRFEAPIAEPSAVHADRVPRRLSAPGTQRQKRLLWVLGIFVGLVFIGSAAFVGINLVGNYRANQATKQTQLAVVLATGGAELPPSWTPEPSSTPAPSATIRPTATITLTPTLSGPTEREMVEIDTIQVEVSDLRGLPIQHDNPTFIVTKRQVRPVLESLYTRSGGTEQEVEDQKQQLVALGLIKPTYNLFDNILNSIADGIGGFFDPATDEIYVIGTRFGGIEHIIYAHEYDHALVYQNFPIVDTGVELVCLENEDACNAFTALVEGDATLLMYQWWEQYASPQDVRDFITYYQSWAALPEQFPPPFAEKNTNFPYVQGLAFVEYLYDRGNWAEVNRAYDNPPLSTEQILHPAKYRSGEAPVKLDWPALTSALDPQWRLLVQDTLGEWNTYLVLGYGADQAAQLEDHIAANAAAGWGGDAYQIYHRPESDQTILAAEWSWDSEGDQNQFYLALSEYLEQRFRGERADRLGGDCWAVNDQISCLFRSGRRTLWLLTPDDETLSAVLSSYPSYP